MKAMLITVANIVGLLIWIGVPFLGGLLGWKVWKVTLLSWLGAFAYYFFLIGPFPVLVAQGDRKVLHEVQAKVPEATLLAAMIFGGWAIPLFFTHVGQMVDEWRQRRAN
jgi:hypothetical protein